MPFGFGGKKKDASSVVAVPEVTVVSWAPAEWSTTGLIQTDGAGQFSVDVRDAEQGKLVVKDLQLRKRQLVANRKTVNAAMTAQRQTNRLTNAKQDASWLFEPSAQGKQIRRREQLSGLTGYDAIKRAADAEIAMVESLILQVEGMILRKQATE